MTFRSPESAGGSCVFELAEAKKTKKKTKTFGNQRLSKSSTTDVNAGRGETGETAASSCEEDAQSFTAC